MLGISQHAKFTCAFLYPIFAIIVLVRYSKDLLRSLLAPDFGDILKRLTLFVGYAALFIIVSVIIINMGYFFNGTLTPLSEYHFKSDLFKSLQSGLEAIKNLPVPLPFPYLQGLDWCKYDEGICKNMTHIYLLGELQKGKGFAGYFFYGILFKVPIAIQIFFFLSIVWYVKKFHRYKFFEDEIFLLIPALFFALYFNYFFESQIGLRYIIVIFPLILIFCGSLLKDVGGIGLRMKGVLVILSIYLMALVLSYFPHYIPYFNEIIGDRKRAYKYLSDSNIDWNQSVWYLEKYKKQNPDIIINPTRPLSGRIVVDANLLTGCVDPERFKWLRENFEPVDHVAYTYFVFDVSPQKLSEALAKDKKKPR